MRNNENFTGREKENVLLTLNEFTKAYKQNTKANQAVIASMKEYQMQTDGLLNKTGESLITIHESLEHIKTCPGNRKHLQKIASSYHKS